MPARVPLRKVRQATATAIENEQVTRKRVDHLEHWAQHAGESLDDTRTAVNALRHATFFGRVRFLVTGRWPDPPAGGMV